jgi:uncharacterized protein (UPF0305 family)
MKNPFVTSRKTVDGVMAAFTQTINDLDTIANQNMADVHALTEQQKQIQLQIEAANAESVRAENISASLRNLIGAN